MKVLVIEDEERAACRIARSLTENQFVVDTCADGLTALEMTRQSEYDLLILDVRLPGRDGWSVLRELREAGSQTPVILVSALGSVTDRVTGLDLGADDYLPKPFSFGELLARVRSVLRRGPDRQREVILVADLEVDLRGLTASRAGRRIDLTPKEFQLLSLLARRPGEVLSRTLISELIWGMDFDCYAHVIDVLVRRLRCKVDDPFQTKLIRTIRGMGYVLGTTA